MKTVRPALSKITGDERTALRDAVAVLVSSAGLLAKHMDRLPPAKRAEQLAALNHAAAQVQHGVELLLEACP